MTDLAAHFLVFTVIAVGGLIVPLLIGRLVRPKLPNAEKESAYECGEPTIGSSYIQFDMRYYVVALLFIVFDVEVAFFFPWASVFGTSAELTDPNLAPAARQALSERLLTPETTAAGAVASIDPVSAETALSLTKFAVIDILVFFAVLLVGFAYLWKRGDIDWVKAVVEQHRQAVPRGQPTSPSRPEVASRPEPVGAAH